MNARVVSLLLCALCFASRQVDAITVNVDEFHVTQGGSLLFQDDFADGVQPPESPNQGLACGTLCWNLRHIGQRAGVEEGGRLHVLPGLGVPHVDPLGRLKHQFRATLDEGLEEGRGFQVSAVFDLQTTGSGFGDTYGIAVADRRGSDRLNDIVELQVALPRSGEPQIRFRKQDVQQGRIRYLRTDNIATTTADQVRLVLANNGFNELIFAGYEFLVGGVSQGFVEIDLGHDPFGSNRIVPIYSGESITFAEFQVSTIPEPGMALMLLVGLGLIGLAVAARGRSCLRDIGKSRRDSVLGAGLAQP